ncbi:MAG: thymidine phosphorylase [candidate division WOR-3 bacterium]|nr:thymidine phosphorylase [candidate division WOR-3 bacterium]
MAYEFIEILIKKRNGLKLNPSEIEFLVKGYTGGSIPDYQFSAFLMAVYFQGMDLEETVHLTRAMLNSGSCLDLSDIKKPRIDKHSTGGVGDKVSIVLAPLVASCGVCVPMISGRSLGHTGGTLDKLESIPGFRTDLSLKEFKKQLKKIDAGFIGQTEEIVPADKMIYSLRDVTATVDSIPLITASIMSKKLAEDLNGLVLDVKFGNGAFMGDYKKAKQLAYFLVQTGKAFGVKTVAVLTDMNNPLGEYIGNSLEILEAIETLKGKGPKDLMEITLTLSEKMLEIAGISGGRNLLIKKIKSGEALAKFREIIKFQGGNTDIIDNYEKLPVAKNRLRLPAHRTGYIKKFDTFKLGMLATRLGAGRLKKDDMIDHGCGFRIYKKTGDFVKKGETIIEIYSDNRQRIDAIINELPSVLLFDKRPVQKARLVRDIIR